MLERNRFCGLLATKWVVFVLISTEYGPDFNTIAPARGRPFGPGAHQGNVIGGVFRDIFRSLSATKDEGG